MPSRSSHVQCTTEGAMNQRETRGGIPDPERCGTN
jgi:hypothetical protein